MYPNRRIHAAYKPNFVAFEVHASRSRHVTFNLSGLPHLYEKSKKLGLTRSRSSYSEFRLTQAGQLGAAAAYIATAALIYQHGRKRSLPVLPALAERL